MKPIKTFWTFNPNIKCKLKCVCYTLHTLVNKVNNKK